MGKTGGENASGLIAKMIAEKIPPLCQKLDMDLIVCIPDEEVYQLIQSYRLKTAQRATHDWSSLTTGNKEQAESLAKQAKEGKLSIFIGAGVSTQAGLPDWTGLLQEVHKELGGKEKDPFKDKPYLDTLAKLEEERRLMPIPGEGEEEKDEDGDIKYLWVNNLTDATLNGKPMDKRKELELVQKEPERVQEEAAKERNSTCAGAGGDEDHANLRRGNSSILAEDGFKSPAYLDKVQQYVKSGWVAAIAKEGQYARYIWRKHADPRLNGTEMDKNLMLVTRGLGLGLGLRVSDRESA